jgi:hypothetical protein
MDEMAKEIGRALDADRLNAPGTVPRGVADGGGGGGVLTTGKISADRNLNSATPSSKTPLTARDRIASSIHELELLKSDLDKLIDALRLVGSQL